MKNRFTKTRQIRIYWILTLLAAVNFAAIGQTSHAVAVTSNKFTPAEITINTGDTVIWTNTQGNHNVNGLQSKFPSNPESFGNDVGSGWMFSHVFTLPGVYDYQCDPHANFGMVGKVNVMGLPPDIVLADDPELGKILTDGMGFTLYYFTKDALPDTSLCTGGCVTNWPLFYAENPKLGEGLDMEDFGVIEHPEGGMQTTYKGWPLYYWKNDLNPGETNGEGVGNVWFVAKPDYSIMLMNGLLIGKDGVTYTSTYEPGEEVVQYFVDEYGRTLYIFVNDTYDKNNFTKEDFSNDGVWPVYEEELQGVASTLDKSMFASIDVFGRQQLTYKGWPLYYFGADAQRGQTTGVSVPSPGIWPVAVMGLEVAPPPDIVLADDPELGKILTDGMGFTLYYFTKDALPDTSLCTGGCVTNWPLFYAENPKLGEGLDMEDFGVIEHPEGGMQTTYKGWPLYYWKNDLNPGETNGEGVGNVWFVAKPDYSIMLMNGLLIGKDGVTYTSTYEPGEEVVQYFVDEYGRTLYIFVKDTYDKNNFTKEDFSNDGVWPVYEEELQGVASTLDKSMFASIDVFGRQQLTYKGWPLYYFGADAQRGQTTGVSVPSPGIWPVAVMGLEVAPPPDIVLADDPELGKILTDGMGFTLYYFTKDALPDTSLCTGGCVTNWPLFYAENPKLGEGLDMEDFGVIEHPEGGMQTTYKGWPLYYWKNDLNPGETNGEGVGNVWFVAKPDYSIMLMNGLLIGKDGVTYTSTYEPGEEVVQYFVDEYGRTLYIFVNDTYDKNNFTKEDFSNDGVWPVYEEELQGVASTLDKALFASINVHGRQQLTYKGWPLYYFGTDSQRGHTTGVSVPSPGVWPVAVMGLENAPVVSSIDEYGHGSGLTVYPNPAFDKLHISSDEAIKSLSVINVLGSYIRQYKNIQANDYSISLDGIEPGIYFLEVESTNEQKFIRRIVKR